MKIQFPFQTYYLRKSADGKMYFSIVFVMIETQKKSQLSFSWAYPSWWQKWLFHFIWNHGWFNKALYQIKVLGFSLRLELDQTHLIPECLRGFIATTDDLEKLENSLK